MDHLEIIDNLRHLPYATDNGPRFSATLKAVPEHFQVEEIMPYGPCGKGDHVYVSLRRAGWNTMDAAGKIATVLGIDVRDMGWAGLKDRHALTTQTFSLKMPAPADLSDITAILTDRTPFDILLTARHTNKIRLGHVRSNRFRIVLSDCEAQTHLAQALSIAQALVDRGMPNYFGPQRFGRDYGNITRADRRISGGKLRRNPKDKFWVSVLQAVWFNIWLGERLKRGDFNRILPGDIAKKQDTGGIFMVEDPQEAQIRLDRHEITYTGPIFGAKTLPAADRAGRFEDELCRRFNIDTAVLKTMKSPGTRRSALLWLDEIRIEPSAEGLVFSFELPSGCYATTLIREFIGD